MKQHQTFRCSVEKVPGHLGTAEVNLTQKAEDSINHHVQDMVQLHGW